MTADAAQVPGRRHRHVVLYDGVCALCNGFVRFVLARDRRGVFAFAPLQGRLGNRVQAGGPLQTMYVLVDHGMPSARALTRAAAVLFVLAALGWPWKASALARALPIAWLDRLYDVVARHRYGVFGRPDVCPLPEPEYRHRFMDDAAGPAGEETP